MSRRVAGRTVRVGTAVGVMLTAAVLAAPAARAADAPASPAPVVTTTAAPVVPAAPTVPVVPVTPVAPTKPAPVKPVVPAGTPQPDPTCKIPSLTVAPMKGGIGSRFLVRGVNFSGCKVVGSPVVPTKVLPLEVGLVAKNAKGGKLEKVLAVGKTTPVGAFAVVVTVPAGPAGGLSAIAAVSIDKATKLTYFAVRPFIVVAPAPVSPTPAPVVAPVVPVTAVNVPTVPGAQPVRVNAGSGGQAATAAGGTGAALPIGLAAGGVLLVGGGVGLRRRSTRGARI